MNILKNKLISAKHTFAVIFVFTTMVLVGVLGTLAISSVQDVFAAINKQINYQGKLTNTSGAAVSDGTYNMEFKLYTVSSGGSPLWTETRTSGDKVQVTNGLFSVLLGEVSTLAAVDFNQTIYLGVNIGGTSTPSWDGEMTPRKKLGAVPAAIVAETLNGLYSSQFFRSDATNATSSAQAFFRIQQSGAGPIAEFVGSASTTAFIVTSGGNVGIGTSTPTEKLELVGGTFKVSNSGKGVYVGDALTGDEAGLYSANAIEQIATFDIGSNFYVYGNGALNVTGGNGNVGIGTTSPSSKLSVAGDINLTGAFKANGDAGTLGMVLQTTGSGTQWVATSSLGLGLSGGTNGYITRWLSASTIGTGLLLDNGTVAGVNATSSTFTFNIQGSSGVNAFNVASSTGTSLFMIDQSGKVGIGTTSPSDTLSVAGALNLTGAFKANGNAGTVGQLLQTTGSGLTWVSTSTLAAGLNYLKVENGGLATATTTDALRAAYFTATSTTATSTFAGRVAIGSQIASTTLHVTGDVFVTATTSTAVLNATNFWDNRRFTTLNDLYETRSFGNFTLQDYYIATSTTDLSASIATGISGVTYNPAGNTVFMVNNNTSSIYEFSLDGVLLRTITLTNFPDAEALAWMYDDVFAVGDENTSTITILRIASTTTSLDRTAGGNISIDISTTIASGTNDGIEGLSYDSDRDVFYVIEEKASANIYKVTRTGATSSPFSLATLLAGVSMTDASEVYFDRNSQHLFITSDEGAGGDKILQVTLQGTLISQLAAPTGFGQVEGIGFTPTGETMFLSGENDTYARYEFARGNNLLALKSSTSADSGKVGIGTSSPSATLTVRGSGGFNPFLIASSTNATMMVVTRTGNVGIGTTTPLTTLAVRGSGGVDPFSIASSSNSTMLMLSQAGNLGIGTTTPSSVLSVAGDFNLTGAMRANGDAGTLGMVLQTTGTGVQWVATSSLGLGGVGGSGTVNSGLLGQVAFYAANGTAVSGTSTLFISGEKIGIGTTTPSSVLSVAGDFNLTGAMRANGDAGTLGMVLQTTGTGVQWVATSSLGLGGVGGSGTVNSGLTGQIAFYAADGTAVSGTSTLFISGEKIGIGTTTPSEKLVVVGTSTMSVLNATRYTNGYRHLSLAQLYLDTEYAKFTQLNIRQATTTPHPPLNYYLATSSTSFAGLGDISGVKYYGKNNTLMFNRNTNGTQRLYEFTIDGRLLRTITLVGFPDPEALDWMYDDWFVIGDENTIGADAGSKITIIQIPDGVTTITRSNGTVIDLSGTIPIDNSSVEGVAYDPIRDVFYVAEEGAGTDANIYQVTRSGVVSTIWNPDVTTMSNLNIGDFSDLYYDKNTEHLFVAVDQCYNQANGGVGCDQVMEIDLSGNVIDRIFAPNGFTQLEGIGFSPDGENMFMAGEVSMYAWYKFQDRHDKLFAYQFSSSTPLTLGIGTTTPSTSLVVQGRAGVDVLTIASSSGSSFMTIAQTGRIGFGTTTPSAFFAMTSTAGSFDVLNIASSSGASMLKLSATGAVSFNNSPGTTGFVLLSQGTSTAPIWVATSSLGLGGVGGSGTVNSGLTGQIAFYAADGTAVSGTSTLFISGEKIGIGTTTPSSRLVVVGTTTLDYLIVGGGTSLSNSIAHFGSDVNSYAQVNVQNRNAGASASSDYVATADDGNDARYYIDLGINSSGYNNPTYSITSARDGYLYTSDGALAIGTGSSTNANAALKFHTGGTTAANERMRISATGDVGIGTTSPMTDLDVFGSMILSAIDSYLNFGNATGTVGYGFRNNAGTIQVKNQGGAWVNIPTSGTTQWTDSGSDIFFNTGNIGIGTSSPAEKLQVAGNILIGKRTDSAGAWTLKSQSTPGTIASGETASIGTTTAMAVYNGSLYVGTMKAGAAEIYRHNGGTSWTRVSSSTPGVISEDAAATSAINSVSAMAVYNGLLYIGTAKTGAAEVYQYNGNSTWTLISSTTAGNIGTSTVAIDSVSAMVVHNGQLIIGTSKASAAEIYRYDINQNANTSQRWTKISSAVAGTIGATTAINGVTSLLSHNGYLYVGVTKANGADVYRMDAPAPTNTFTRINAAAGSFTVATAVDNVRTLAVFNGSLFAGIDDGAGTARVVRWNGNYTAGTVWSAVSSTTAGVIAEDVGSQTGIDRIGSMSVYKNDLYVGTVDSTGIGQVYKFDGGTTWSIVSSSTAGVIPTTGTGHNSGISGVTAMAVYNDDLWIGTEEAASAEVYSFNSVEGESNKLRFEAQSDNADGIQNALGNFGEIQFLAEENGRNVNGNMNTGVFSFSHGINTAVGAYDLAEDYPTRDDTLSPGDLVSLDIREKGFVRKAQGKNDRDIIGIYSIDPALRLSQKGPLIDGARAVPIALAGRVPVTVTLENGPIKIGDYLTSSLEPGKAAKANRPGRVVGRALGNYSGLEGEEAKVTVFLGLESIDWNDIQTAQEEVEELTDASAPKDANVIAEFVDTVNTAAEDIVFALLNKADNVSVVITNQFTTLFASIQELFVRTLAILPGGSFIVPSGENQISGTATMPAGATDVLIPNEQVDEQSIVYISPTSAIDAPLYVARKVKGKGFHVRLKEPFNEDITFDWFFIKTYIPKNTQGGEVNTIVNQATSTDPGQSGTTTITIISPDAGGVSSQAETTPVDEVSSGDIGSGGGTITSEGNTDVEVEGGNDGDQVNPVPEESQPIVEQAIPPPVIADPVPPVADPAPEPAPAPASDPEPAPAPAE